MRTLIFGFIVLAGVVPALAHADGCYLCQEGGYVKYQGDDTFPKRKKAKEQFGCTVTGTTSTCSNSRGSVAWYQRGNKNARCERAFLS